MIKKMNKLLLAIGMIALLAGCKETDMQHQPIISKQKTMNGNQAQTIYMVDGKPLECIRKIHMLSCNWPKHNKLFEGE